MKKFLVIVVLGLTWSTEAFARVRICHGSGSCDHLILPGALIALGISGFFLYNYLSVLKYDQKVHNEINKEFDMKFFLKNHWSDLLFCLVFFIMGIYLLSEL